ncbi:MAG: hypothetical protein JXR86_19825 [Spirochaetales bacterium]|nr:hypothetical protein [Spirochaetales bacterium]
MKKISRILPVLLFLFYSVSSGHSENIFSLDVQPFGSLPLGSSSDVFSFGGGAELTLSLFPPALGVLGFQVAGDFLLLPLVTEDSVWAVSGGIGPVLRIPLGDRIRLYGRGYVGYYYFDTLGWEKTSDASSDFTFGGGAGANFLLGNVMALGIGASWDYYMNLYNGVSFILSLRLDFDSERKERTPSESPGKVSPELLKSSGTGIKLSQFELQPLFPVLYKYYDSNPVGSVLVENNDTLPAEEVSIRFYSERYMDNYMEVTDPFTLEAGEKRVVELYGLFTEDMMSITEGTKASASVKVSWNVGGAEYEEEYTPILECYNRNALTWDDDRKIASFITAKDPDILNFAKNVTTWMQEVKNPAIDQNLQKAMILFETVKKYGIRYEVDPTTPFSTLSRQETVIDFLQFPRQTLQYSNGDCDDLSALYTSLLEAVGVETAVITIPGHIFAAFALKQSSSEALHSFSKADELILIDDKPWIPVEITLFQDSFEKAWQTGAKEWRENNARNQASFYATRDSWGIYQAVGFNEGSGNINLPGKNEILEEYTKSLNRYVDREIYPQLTRLQSRGLRQEDPVYQNKLAVLYARYGQYEKAYNSFMEALKKQEYKPALINLGNLQYLKKDFNAALDFYERALKQDGSDRKALLGAARCNHELENYGLVGRMYDQLKVLDSDLAMQYSYLALRSDDATRAADVTAMKDIVLWEDEE